MNDEELDKKALAAGRVLICMGLTGWAACIFATADRVPLADFCALAFATLMLALAFVLMYKGVTK